MSDPNLPPIIQQAERVRAMIETAVAGWARAHRYASGTVLRQQARIFVKTTHRLWSGDVDRAHGLEQLDSAIADLKMEMRLGQAVKAFRSFGEFDAIMQEILGVGRQCGALKRAQRQQHPKGQNATRHARRAASQDTEYPGRLSGANP